MTHLLLVIQASIVKPKYFMGCKPFDAVAYGLGPLFKDQMWVAKLKMLISYLLVVVGISNLKLICRMLHARIQFDVVTFYLMLPFHGQNKEGKVKSP